MKRALVVGIDDYPDSPLSGCVSDAQAVGALLGKNWDGSPNFECQVMTAPGTKISRALLRERIESLFANEADVALLYFSGHGTYNNLGGYLVTSDAGAYDEGVPMTSVLTLANKARVREVVVVLDCCHSGAFGQPQASNDENSVAKLREGVSVLTASRAHQPALASEAGSIFTNLLCGALDGGAADVLGKVTVASAYTYVEEALGAWEQRPLFKCHLTRVTPLRACRPVVALDILRMLPKYFPAPQTEFQLNPSFEPTVDPRDSANEAIFGHLQKLRAVRLVEPVGEEHLYFAAMNSKSCRLTPLGHHYWRLANGGKI